MKEAEKNPQQSILKAVTNNTEIKRGSELKTLRSYAVFLTTLWLLFTGLFFYFHGHLADVLKNFFSPLLQEKNWSIINLQLTSAFSLLLSFSAFLGAIATLPFLLGLCWSFIHPGLYPHEKHTLALHLGITLLLVVVIQLFSFLFVIPSALNFFLGFHEQFFDKILDFQSLLGFILSIQKGFFLCSLLPVALSCLLRLKILSLHQIHQSRRIFYLLAFIIGMLLTPPDVLSQCLLAFTLIALFEGTIFSLTRF